MELNEYRLEEYSGEIYTEEEFLEKYLKEIPDIGVVGSEWDRMSIVPVEGCDLEEVRKKMRYLHKKGGSIHRGDIIKTDLSTRYSAIVQRTCGRIMVLHTNSISFAEEEWQGPYIKMASGKASVVDLMQPAQMAYNIVMNQLGSK